MADFFSRAAHWTADRCGRASTFALACFSVVVWAATGPIFHFSDTWQLVINTGTTIITFLMIFLLQHAQNRDSTAIQIKLDELIRVNHDARNKLFALEDLTEAEVAKIKASFASLAGEAGASLELAEAAEDLQDARRDIAEAQEHLEGARAKQADRTP